MATQHPALFDVLESRTHQINISIVLREQNKLLNLQMLVALWQDN